jgi:menaquinone-9 beta-reductase
LAVPILVVMEAAMTLDDAAARRWDAVVVGAGPAGAVTARELARHGRSVLLVDKARFPRWKVCGCCLSGAALASLRNAGLGDLPKRCGAVRLTSVLLSSGNRLAKLSLPEGMSLSRERFDTALIQEAVRAGAAFLPETHVSASTLESDSRSVELRQRERIARIDCRIVVAADGLNSRLLGFGAVQAVTGSRIGAGAAAASAPDFFAPGVVYMACSRHGYVGLVRLEDGRLDVAAAFDVNFVRAHNGLGASAARILAETAWPTIDNLAMLDWRGTPALTRQPARPAATRLFAVGDAAGYVEPFTGEGIAWALVSATALAPIVHHAIDAWNERLIAAWATLHQHMLGPRLRLCRFVTGVLRSQRWTRLAVGALSLAPSLARPILRRLNRVPVVPRRY